MLKSIKGTLNEDASDSESDYIKNRLLEKRIILIDEEFSTKSVGDWVGRILLLDLKPTEIKKPIILLINSFGGDSYAGLGMVSIIKKTKNPVYTCVMGTAMSAASIILAAGKRRFAIPGSRVMIHGHYETFQADTTLKPDEMMIAAEEAKEMIEIDKKFWMEITGLTAAKVMSLLKLDTYMSAEEALSNKIIDKVGWDIHNWIK